VVVPSAGDPRAHGWVALFPTGEAPRVSRFGPVPPQKDPEPGQLFGANGVRVQPGLFEGHSAGASWTLRWRDESPPLYTFPRWAWERDVLPGVQIVPAPSASFEGDVDVLGHKLRIVHGRGAVARIFGHGNAQRWGWLHADLGDGDVLEVVAAVPRRAGLVSVPPVTMVQLRCEGRDWPRSSLLAAPVFRARLGLPAWSVHGTFGHQRLKVEVALPEDASLRLAYADPDGSTATCTNSERADARVVLQRRGSDGRRGRRGPWRDVRRWSLLGTAHAEIGTRP
jgi:hypothetical protein